MFHKNNKVLFIISYKHYLRRIFKPTTKVKIWDLINYFDTYTIFICAHYNKMCLLFSMWFHWILNEFIGSLNEDQWTIPTFWLYGNNEFIGPLSKDQWTTPTFYFVVVISNVIFSFTCPYLGNQKKTFILTLIPLACSIHLTPNLEEIFFTLGHL